MEIICAGVSDIGRKRETNQDSIYISNKSQLYIVADGMGGHSGGELASTMAIKYLAENVKSLASDDGNKNHAKILEDSLLHANRKIKSYADGEPSLKGMGTTVVGLYIQDGKASLANVGDSRAYVISNKEIFQLSKDHSVIHEKINFGIYTRQEAANDPNKNFLSRTVGFEDEVEVDIFDYQPKKGDIFLLCSDGLHGKLSDEDILFIIKDMLATDTLDHQKLHDCVQTLVRQANEHGGQDNISVILTAIQ